MCDLFAERAASERLVLVGTGFVGLSVIGVNPWWVTVVVLVREAGITLRRCWVIRHGVMIGAGAKILGRIEIGAESKVAAGSVVLKDVPPRCTVAGVPAQIVRVHAPHEVPAAAMIQDI